MNILIIFLEYLYYALSIYFYFMVAVIIVGWIPGIREYRWFQVCERIVDFYLGRFRGLLVFNFIDFTPILGFIIYQLALRGIAYLINYLII